LLAGAKAAVLMIAMLGRVRGVGAVGGNFGGGLEFVLEEVPEEGGS